MTEEDAAHIITQFFFWKIVVYLEGDTLIFSYIYIYIYIQHAVTQQHTKHVLLFTFLFNFNVQPPGLLYTVAATGTTPAPVVVVVVAGSVGGCLDTERQLFPRSLSYSK